MSDRAETIAVLLMAYGSPESLDQMEAYLLDVREGRQPSEELVKEISERYAHIGGKSPLLERTREQADALEKELNRRHTGDHLNFKTYVGMRHWEPRIAKAVEQIEADGIKKGIAMVLAPHNSNLSIGKYYLNLEEALQDSEIDFARIESWHKHPGFLAAVSEQIESGLNQFDDAMPYVIFTAHSLPTAILETNDPYDDQLNETAGLLAERFSLEEGRWQFCYQSAGATAIPWLGPQIEEVVEQLAKAGEKNLLVVPIGFVSDHVEVLYDIDVDARQIAQRFGAKLVRSPSLNSAPTFIKALADIVEQYL